MGQVESKQNVIQQWFNTKLVYFDFENIRLRPWEMVYVKKREFVPFARYQDVLGVKQASTTINELSVTVKDPSVAKDLTNTYVQQSWRGFRMAYFCGNTLREKILWKKGQNPNKDVNLALASHLSGFQLPKKYHYITAPYIYLVVDVENALPESLVDLPSGGQTFREQTFRERTFQPKQDFNEFVRDPNLVTFGFVCVKFELDKNKYLKNCKLVHITSKEKFE